MICLDIEVDKLKVKGAPRTNGSYNSHQIRLDKDYLEIVIPKMEVPYYPKDTKNSNGETFMREYNLKLVPGNDEPNDRHVKEFVKKLESIRQTIEDLTDIPIKSPIFTSEVAGSLFSVKIKTKFGTSNFNVNCFDKDGKYVENMDTSKLKGHIISGKIKLERVWSKKDGSNGGLDWVFTQIRDYGLKETKEE